MGNGKKKPLSVVDWLDSDEVEGKPVSVGWMGGWFGMEPFDKDEPGKARGLVSHRWKDYLEALEDIGEDLAVSGEALDRTLNYPVEEYAEAIRTRVVADGIRASGNWHQEEGHPLFSDGTVGVFSCRAWGDLLAAIWSEEEDKDYHYMNFYWE